MGLKIKTTGICEDRKQYTLLISIVVFSAVLFNFAYLLEDSFYKIMDVATYLTWHNIFEFSGILVCFAVFVVSYFTYDQTRNTRLVFLGCVFLAVGLIDAFHTLSFKGMPDFFISNSSANRATAFWIISRLVSAFGFIVAGIIPTGRKSYLNKRIFILPVVLFSFLVLIIATYYPHLLPPMYIEGEGLTLTKIILEYVVVILFLVAMIIFMREYKRTKDFLIILYCCAFILNIFSELAFVSYNKVYDIYNYLGHIYKFISYFIIFRVIFISNVRKPYTDLKAAQDELNEYVENLDKIVEQRTGELKKANKILVEDLEYARDIQRALLPLQLPETKGAAFAARYFSAERVSGDFYNVFKIDEDNIGLYLGDVSGHGVPAAMLTVFAKQSIKSGKESCMEQHGIIWPSIVLESVYESFNNTNFKDEVYIVLFFGIYNTRRKELTYASAGINVSPLIIRNSGEITELEVSGFPICMFKDYYSVNYEDKSIKLNEGEKVLFYTDGLIEAENEYGGRYTDERLKNIVEQNSQKSGARLAEILEENVFNFVGSRKLNDDITFFIMDTDNAN